LDLKELDIKVQEKMTSYSPRSRLEPHFKRSKLGGVDV
jgi:hypothetical protein